MYASRVLVKFALMPRIAALLLALSLPAAGQQFEYQPRPKDEPRPAPYLAERVDFRGLLPASPANGSFSDDQDRRTVGLLQETGNERFRLAELDSRFLYPRFSEAFGEPIDRARLPATVHLLNRAMRDVAATTFAAKDHFRRARPYQNVQLARLCGSARPPAPEPNPTERSSYPSGHGSYGWAVAMILARLKPERAAQLLERAAEYGESRVVCGLHYPSDVAAGRVIAAAVVATLAGNPQFDADLERARAELRFTPPGSSRP
jgi:acid phosphatase (class A)